MQADPFVDGVTSTQGYNRYSYVHNNPLKYTDPSGYCADFFSCIFEAIVFIFELVVQSYGFEGFAQAVYTIANIAYAADGIFGVISGSSSSAFGNQTFGQQVNTQLEQWGLQGEGGFARAGNSSPTPTADMTVGATYSDVTGGKFVNGGDTFSFGLAQDPNIAGGRAAEIAMDVAGIFDPSPTIDIINGTILIEKGDRVGGILTYAGVIPIFGDIVGKGGKWLYRAGKEGFRKLKKKYAAKATKEGQKALPAPKTTKPKGNVNGAPENGTIFVDSKGNAIPTPPGGRITGSPDGRFIQARDANGNPTGVRIDGGHSPKTHNDPRALGPHGHVPGVKNADGTPWLPINQ